jgi:hypothetical protein
VVSLLKPLLKKVTPVVGSRMLCLALCEDGHTFVCSRCNAKTKTHQSSSVRVLVESRLYWKFLMSSHVSSVNAMFSFWLHVALPANFSGGQELGTSGFHPPGVASSWIISFLIGLFNQNFISPVLVFSLALFNWQENTNFYSPKKFRGEDSRKMEKICSTHDPFLGCLNP